MDATDRCNGHYRRWLLTGIGRDRVARAAHPDVQRRFREVRRRTRPMGVMANPDSIERLLFAVFAHENHKQGATTSFLIERTLNPSQNRWE